MSKFLADHLTEPVLSRLSRAHAIERAHLGIVIATVDEHGWPHPSMLSSLEVVARDARNIRLAAHARSRTTRNLRQNGKLTMTLIDEGGVFYIKGDVLEVRSPVAEHQSPVAHRSPEIVVFNMRVDSVLEDHPAAYEPARITSGIRVEREIDHDVARKALDDLLDP
ncbi:MAG TPA: pyridoxamine 5'-phosphate oxidase family protein [Vicinamibacterales bacterium]|nr:pyridoxamine 5'-phosphate oxidase family protein [Vicinamibacterales bacterium]